MKKRKIADLQTEEGRIIEVELFYDMGGVNPATGKLRSRGYYLLVVPVTIEDHGDHITRKYEAYAGVVQKVKDAKRFSLTTMVSFVPNKILIKDLVNKVVEKNNLTLKEQLKLKN